MRSQTDIREALGRHLKELRLPTFRSAWEETAERAEKEGLTCEQYLLELADAECDARRGRRVERQLRRSGLPRAVSARQNPYPGRG